DSASGRADGCRMHRRPGTRTSGRTKASKTDVRIVRRIHPNADPGRPRSSAGGTDWRHHPWQARPCPSARAATALPAVFGPVLVDLDRFLRRRFRHPPQPRLGPGLFRTVGSGLGHLVRGPGGAVVDDRHVEAPGATWSPASVRPEATSPTAACSGPDRKTATVAYPAFLP